MQFIQGTNRNQTYFTTLEQQVAADNPVRIINAFVDKLDLKKLGLSNTGHKSEGRPPYAPQVLLNLYLYGYDNKIRSSRKLEQKCLRNVELRWLMQELSPNYHIPIAIGTDFRKKHNNALKNLFKLSLRFLDELNLPGKQTIAVDGSKFRAVNSRKNNYNQKKIDKHQAMIEQKADNYLKELDELDRDETGDSGPAYRKEEVEAALQKLIERKIKYDQLQQQLNNTEKKQISTTDAESRAMIINKNFVELNKRIIHRSEYQDAVERNNENICQNPDYYKRRQSICGHPFGTIKRQYGYTYTLMKGPQKVNGEMNLIMLVYNLRRTLSLLGFEKC